MSRASCIVFVALAVGACGKAAVPAAPRSPQLSSRAADSQPSMANSPERVSASAIGPASEPDVTADFEADARSAATDATGEDDVAAAVNSPDVNVVHDAGTLDPDVTTSADGAAILAVVSPETAITGVSDDREPSIVTPLPELCRQACANAQRLVLAELPEDTAKAMREEVERSLVRDCPGRCLQRASLDSAKCFAGAQSALELAACP